MRLLKHPPVVLERLGQLEDFVRDPFALQFFMSIALESALVQRIHVGHQENSSMYDQRPFLEFEASKFAFVLALPEHLGQIKGDGAVRVCVRLLHGFHRPNRTPDVQHHVVCVGHQRRDGVAISAFEKPY